MIQKHKQLSEMLIREVGSRSRKVILEEIELILINQASHHRAQGQGERLGNREKSDHNQLAVSFRKILMF